MYSLELAYLKAVESGNLDKAEKILKEGLDFNKRLLESAKNDEQKRERERLLVNNLLKLGQFYEKNKKDDNLSSTFYQEAFRINPELGIEVLLADLSD